MYFVHMWCTGNRNFIARGKYDLEGVRQSLQHRKLMRKSLSHLQFKLMKGNALGKHSLHEKTAASVL